MRMYLSVLLVAFLVAACGPVKVKTDVDKSVEFSQLKVFSWLETKIPPGDDVRVDDPKLIALVRASMEKNLLEKGFVKGENPDFLINWLGAIERKVETQSIEHFYSNYGYGAMAKSYGPMARAGRSQGDGIATKVPYEEGTIIIDILDPANNVILWRGSGTRRLQKGMDEKQVSQYVEHSVSEILKNFPPKSK